METVPLALARHASQTSCIKFVVRCASYCETRLDSYFPCAPQRKTTECLMRWMPTPTLSSGNLCAETVGGTEACFFSPPPPPPVNTDKNIFSKMSRFLLFNQRQQHLCLRGWTPHIALLSRPTIFCCQIANSIESPIRSKSS